MKILSNVRHVPELERNLISLGMLEEAGCSYKAEKGTLKIIKGSLVIMNGTRDHDIYLLNGPIVTGMTAMTIQASSQANMWHQRLGNVSLKGMQVLDRQGMLGGDKISELEFCEHCVYGNMHRVKFSTGKHFSKGIMEYVYSDLWGPAKIASH
ncbi:uncharacterized mitochondrial protein AtMg00300-like [Cicer arietinum]|uniref:Uncharacterized protein LOC113784915 n=1 Tax=Cicer arietinum TaxID=3827 RepID=A0A3Q7XSZ7_CICAR|nr:uncharacterized protein LOC113784915 [Cicer arietinum]